MFKISKLSSIYSDITSSAKKLLHGSTAENPIKTCDTEPEEELLTVSEAYGRVLVSPKVKKIPKSYKEISYYSDDSIKTEQIFDADTNILKTKYYNKRDKKLEKEIIIDRNTNTEIQREFWSSYGDFIREENIIKDGELISKKTRDMFNRAELEYNYDPLSKISNEIKYYGDIENNISSKTVKQNNIVISQIKYRSNGSLSCDYKYNPISKHAVQKYYHNDIKRTLIKETHYKNNIRVKEDEFYPNGDFKIKYTFDPETKRAVRIEYYNWPNVLSCEKEIVNGIKIKEVKYYISTKTNTAIKSAEYLYDPITKQTTARSFHMNDNNNLHFERVEVNGHKIKEDFYWGNGSPAYKFRYDDKSKQAYETHFDMYGDVFKTNDPMYKNHKRSSDNTYSSDSRSNSYNSSTNTGNNYSSYKNGMTKDETINYFSSRVTRKNFRTTNLSLEEVNALGAVLEIPSKNIYNLSKQDYRNLCIKYHPDKNPNNTRADKLFRIVTTLYNSK